MGAVKHKKMILLMVLSLWSVVGQAATCYRSKPEVTVKGIEGASSVTILWNDNGDGVDELRVDGQRVKIRTDLFCSDAPPIGCSLAEDGGRIGLLFSGNRLKLVTRGEFRVTLGDGADLHLSVQQGRGDRVVELDRISAFNCRRVFRAPRIIEVFPSDTSAPQAPDANTTR